MGQELSYGSVLPRRYADGSQVKKGDLVKYYSKINIVLGEDSSEEIIISSLLITHKGNLVLPLKEPKYKDETVKHPFASYCNPLVRCSQSFQNWHDYKKWIEGLDIIVK